MSTPFLRSLPRVAHISHRGGSALAPENTLPAFQQAVERFQTDVLELDVQPTRDGHVVVFHDDTLERTTNGQGPIRALDLAQLQALDAGFHLPGWQGKGVHISTLEEVLRAFPTMPINMELKVGEPAFMDAVVAILKSHSAVDRVCVGHVEYPHAMELKQRLPTATFWAPQEVLLEFVMCSRSGEPVPQMGNFQVLSLPVEYGGMEVVDQKLVDDAHASGHVVHVWTVDDAPTMERLIARGVDGILTDRPDVLRTVLGAGKRPS